MLGPVLEGEKIRLEPARAEHLPEFIRWFSDMRVTRYLLTRFPMTLEQEPEWFANVARDRNTVHWTITVGDRPIGVTGIHNIDWISRGADTGTIIGLPDEWGKGYASDAVGLRTKFAFSESNLEPLRRHSFAPNRGMHKALERSGYRRIGARTHAMYSRWAVARHLYLRIVAGRLGVRRPYLAFLIMTFSRMLAMSSVVSTVFSSSA